MENSEFQSTASPDGSPDAAILPRPEWRLPVDGNALQLVTEGRIHATIARWIDVRTGELVGWPYRTLEPPAIGCTDTLTEACREVARQTGIVLDPPHEMIAAYDGTAMTDGPADLDDRLARALADVVDAVLLTVGDPDRGDRRIELRLACFRPDLAERACDLLEETGH